MKILALYLIFFIESVNANPVKLTVSTPDKSALHLFDLVWKEIGKK